MRKLVTILVIFFTVCIYSQTVTKVLISGSEPAHEQDVKKAFLLGYSSYDGSQYSGQIDIHNDDDAYNTLTYASQNNYQVAVRSYTGLDNVLNGFAKNYPDVLLFMPAGSNDYVYVCNLDIPNSSIVSTGCGVDSLLTGYKVEFYSIDPITSSNYSSFSNGYIAGQITFLANHLNISLSDARKLARENSDNTSKSQYVEYGQINIVRAISALPVEVVQFAATVKNDKVLLNWQTVTEINNYGFTIQRSTSPLPSPYQGEGDPAGRVGRGWVDVGFVQGAGNSNSTNHYKFTDRPTDGIEFSYRIKQIDKDGNFQIYDAIPVKLDSKNSAELMQNNPNPFNPSTRIKYYLPNTSDVKITIYDMLGKEVTTLVNQQATAGYHITYWNGRDWYGRNAASGIYLYRLTAGSFVQTKKMILMK